MRDPSPTGIVVFMVRSAAPLRSLFLVLVLALAVLSGLQPSGAGTGPGASPTGGVDPASCQRFYLPAVGTVCDAGHGMYLVFDPAGVPLGLTHGADPLPPSTQVNGAPALPASPPQELRDQLMEAGVGDGRMGHCIDDPVTEYYIQVVYARAFDDDVFQHTDDYVRMMAKQANLHMDVAGMANSIHNDLRFLCSQGQIDVNREVLWTPYALSDFGTISGELRDRGYDQGRIKSWILFDDVDPAGGAAGVANMMTDDTKSVGNFNNGLVPQWAVTFDSDFTTFLHEGGHTMGAVQYSAWHSSLGAHCYDGGDIMCYADGGANESLYATTYCAGNPWDCNQDDYYNTMPPAGSYIDENWNIGHPNNRFVDFDESTLDYLKCSEDGIEGVPVACVYQGGNTEAVGVTYEIDWGDGTPVVTDGGYAPKDITFLEHTYAAPGEYTVKVRARDVGGVASTPSGWVPFTILIKADPTAPIAGDCVNNLTGAQSFDDCPVRP